MSSGSGPVVGRSASTRPSPLKIVHASSVHPTDDIRIFVKECRSLAAAGHEVVLYGRSDVAVEVVDGVTRKAVRRSHGRLDRMVRTVWSLLPRLLAERADVYHVHDPELIPLAGLMKLLGKTVVYDAHEDLPLQVGSKPWIRPALRPVVSRAARLLVWFAGRGVNGVVGVTQGITDTFGAKHSAVVANYAPIRFDDHPRPFSDRGTAVCFVGGINEVRGIEVMLRAAELIHSRTGESTVLVGPCEPPALAERLEGLDPANGTRYLGIVEQAEAHRLMGDAKVGLLLYQPIPAHIAAQPNKLFEYMAAGTVVVAADYPLWRQIVDGSSAGLMVDPTDAEAVADEVTAILTGAVDGAAMSSSGRRAAAERFTWTSQVSNLENLYAGLMIGKPSRQPTSMTN